MSCDSVRLIIYQRNVLLDSDLHCKIIDFGSTRHSEATGLLSTTALTLNFAAPELFGVCAKCGQSTCKGCHGDRDVQHTIKTMETDVYAFGCLYYAVRFRSSFSLSTSSDDINRRSLILPLSTNIATFKSCNSSQVGYAQIS